MPGVRFRLLKPRVAVAILCLLFIGGQTQAGQVAVASAHPLATRAGIEILQNGGNAFDAAIAVSAVLAVVEPYSSGIGGGGFYLLHRARDNRQVMLDARERAPLLGHRDMYLDSSGKVVSDLSMNGAMAAGIPGIPAAFEHLQRHYGNLQLQRSLSRAIEYAEQGFEIEDYYRRMADFRLEVLQRYASTRPIFLRDGEVPASGTLIRQTDLARTLRAIAAQGRDGFYRGEVAGKLVDAVRANGGIWSLQDLNQYQVVEREPVRFRYRDAEIIAASLPSSGGIVLAAIFNMLDELRHHQAGPVLRVHQLVEAMRRAYRDRAEYLGDSDYVEVPVERLTSRAYARELLRNYSAQKATPSSELRAIADSGGGADTTHFSIVDDEGNMVAATLSINDPFGSGLVAAGTGVLLNDEMDDFSASPGVPNAYGLLGSGANAIEPGKRMLSSMTPAFVRTSKRTLVSGTPGGSRIITMQLLGMLEFLKGSDAHGIVSRPRFHHQYFPDAISHEDNAFDQALIDGLRSRGHQLKQMSYRYGDMHSIIIDHQSGKLDAASDPRIIGSAVVAD